MDCKTLLIVTILLFTAISVVQCGKVKDLEQQLGKKHIQDHQDAFNKCIQECSNKKMEYVACESPDSLKFTTVCKTTSPHKIYRFEVI